MPNYASRTSVSVDRSVVEIQSTLRRYGADGFLYGEENGQALLSFTRGGLKVRFILTMPPLSDFMETETGRDRKATAARKAWDQETRRRWRALALVVKAKLEAVDTGMVLFEDEFLAYIVTKDGKTVGDHMRPKLAEAFDAGKMSTRLFPLPKKRRSDSE